MVDNILYNDAADPKQMARWLHTLFEQVEDIPSEPSEEMLIAADDNVKNWPKLESMWVAFLHGLEKKQ